MPQDTTTITIHKDSSNLTKSFVEKVTTIETITRDKVDYLSKGLDFISDITWPLIIMILLFAYKRSITNLIHVLGEKIRSSKTIQFSKDGILLHSELKVDEAITSQTEVFPDVKQFETMAKQILSTLWVQQNDFDSSYNNRWTFTLGTDSPNFIDFERASKNLRITGLVTIALTNGQLFLTNLGIQFCKKHEKELGDFSFLKNL